jgi:hypothetical protein
VPTSKINSYVTPESTDKPVVAEDLAKIVNQMMLGDVMYFASTAERTAVFAALGVSPPKGAVSYLADLDRYERYNAGWGPLPLAELVDAVDIGIGITPYTTSGSTELDIGRLANTNVQLINGQLYRNDAYLITTRTTAADEFLVRIRQGTPVSGALLAEEIIYGEANTSGQEAIAPLLWAWSSATVTTTLYLSVARNSGGGTMSVFGQLGTRARPMNILTRCGPSSRYRTISS